MVLTPLCTQTISRYWVLELCLNKFHRANSQEIIFKKVTTVFNVNMFWMKPHPSYTTPTSGFCLVLLKWMRFHLKHVYIKNSRNFLESLNKYNNSELVFQLNLTNICLRNLSDLSLSLEV